MLTTILFFITILTIYSLLNYIVYKIYLHFYDLFKFKKYIVFTIIFLSLQYPLSRFLNSYKISTLFEFVGVLWFIFIIHIFFVSPFIYFSKKFIPIIQQNKRKFMSFITIGIIVFLLYGNSNFNDTKVQNVYITINKKTNIDSLNIVFISDIHLGNLVTPEKLNEKIKIINHLNPDIVAIGGDLFDYGINSVDTIKLKQVLKKIKSKYGIYFVNGNHDLFSSNDKILNVVKNSNITVLIDTFINVQNSFYIVGRQDRSIMRSDKQRKPLKQIIKTLDKTKPIIVLDHQPVDIDETIKNNIDLQLSGHTHHGQFFPITEVVKAIYKVSWGYLKQNNTNIYVSSGLFVWGPPIRTGSNSEIVFLKIKFGGIK